MKERWNTTIGRPKQEQIEFKTASWAHVDNCKKGHCGCYYTNCNRCCRCKKYQYERTMIERHVNYDDTEPTPAESKRWNVDFNV